MEFWTGHGYASTSTIPKWRRFQEPHGKSSRFVSDSLGFFVKHQATFGTATINIINIYSLGFQIRRKNGTWRYSQDNCWRGFLIATSLVKCMCNIWGCFTVRELHCRKPIQRLLASIQKSMEHSPYWELEYTFLYPIGSMCGIFIYIYPQNQPDVGAYKYIYIHHTWILWILHQEYCTWFGRMWSDQTIATCMCDLGAHHAMYARDVQGTHRLDICRLFVVFLWPFTALFAQ